MCGQLVVFLGTRLAEVDVLEQVGERPTVGATDRVGREARCIDGLRGREQIVPGRRRLDTGIRERRDVVPNGRLVGGLEEEPVKRSVDRAELDRIVAKVRLHIVFHEVERLQRLLPDEVLHEPRLRQERHVGRIPALDRRRELRRQLVARRCVLDIHVRVLLGEPVEHCLERLLLGAGPDAHDRDASGGATRPLGGPGALATGRTSVVPVATATGRHRGERESEQERDEMEAMPSHAAPFIDPS